MSQLATKILEFTSNTNFSRKIQTVINHLDLDSDDREKIHQYYKKRMISLYEMALDFSLNNVKIKLSEADKQHIDNETQAQLNYWWLEIQSEWIRYNNLLNFKTAILGKTDKILQAKASVTSYFLNPTAKLLDEDLLNKNMEYLVSLVERSQFTADESQNSASEERT